MNNSSSMGDNFNWNFPGYSNDSWSWDNFNGS